MLIKFLIVGANIVRPFGRCIEWKIYQKENLCGWKITIILPEVGFFVTICVANRESLLRKTDTEAVNMGNFPPLSEYGEVVDSKLKKIPEIYFDVLLDKYCIMPDHIHLIINVQVSESATELSRIIKQFKGSVSKEIGKSIWQKSFYDHIIRNEEDYKETCKYIYDNPLHWEFDFIAK